MSDKQTLAGQYSKRVDVPFLLITALALLVLGITRPLLTTEKLLFWKDTYTIVSGIGNLFKGGNIFIASIILLFSIIFPALKLLSLLAVWFIKTDKRTRDKIINWIEVMGRWSMLDVFVVASVIIIIRSGWMSRSHAQEGLYIFSAAILLSMVVTLIIKHLSRKAG